MPEEAHARALGYGVLQYFEPFSREFGAIPVQPCDVSARLGEVGDDARGDQVRRPHHNGDGGGRLLGRQHPNCRPGEEEVGSQVDQLGSELGQRLGLALGITIREADGVPLYVAEVVEALTEEHVAALRRRGGWWAE